MYLLKKKQQIIYKIFISYHKINYIWTKRSNNVPQQQKVTKNKLSF